jgi:hypothetical protein
VAALALQSNELPLSFEFDKIPQFKTEPVKGKLLAGQSSQVLLSFLPKQLGPQSQVLNMWLDGGIVTYPLRLKGTSSSTVRLVLLRTSNHSHVGSFSLPSLRRCLAGRTSSPATSSPR